MQIFNNPNISTWKTITERPKSNFSSQRAVIQDVFDEIANQGDKAVRNFTRKFDNIEIDDFRVTELEINEAVESIDNELKIAINVAANNIRKFHESQLLQPTIIETMPGVKCWQKSVAIENIGFYIPGGSAPLFSTVLMLGIPAQIAGCKHITLCTPPNKEGKIHPAILFSARLCGITSIFKVGGSQAIAAMAIGTETIMKVDKIFGPGNSWVMIAKQLASLSYCSIDMPAGPSELLVIADSTSNPVFVAADLLSQAEHGADSQVILVTNDNIIVEKVKSEIETQLEILPRSEIAKKALENSRAIVLSDDNKIISFTNSYAPEHLIIATKNAAILAEKVTNAGSIFIGNFTPESAGDYASGTNHTLPTNGWSRSVSGLNLDSFLKKITFQEISAEGLRNIGNTIEIMAEAEQLFAHKNAVTIRLKAISSKN